MEADLQKELEKLKELNKDKGKKTNMNKQIET